MREAATFCLGIGRLFGDEYSNSKATNTAAIATFRGLKMESYNHMAFSVGISGTLWSKDPSELERVLSIL